MTFLPTDILAFTIALVTSTGLMLFMWRQNFYLERENNKLRKSLATMSHSQKEKR